MRNIAIGKYNGAVTRHIHARVRTLSRKVHKQSMTAPRALLALGSNLGDRARAINRAVAALSPFARVTATSSLYESAPQYVQDQPSFLNAVVEVITELQPSALLHELKRVERALGRRSGVRWGPREIDLDLVLYGEPSADAAFGTVLRVEATHDAPHALELPHASQLKPAGGFLHETSDADEEPCVLNRPLDPQRCWPHFWHVLHGTAVIDDPVSTIRSKHRGGLPRQTSVL